MERNLKPNTIIRAAARMSLAGRWNTGAAAMLIFLLLLAGCVRLIVALGALLFFIPGLIAALGYSMTFFILRDNGDMSVAEAMEESWTMMCGHKWACFRLWMSFIGWTILAVISVAGILWLVPYFCTAMAEFYNRVRGYRACCLG